MTHVATVPDLRQRPVECVYERLGEELNHNAGPGMLGFLTAFSGRTYYPLQTRLRGSPGAGKSFIAAKVLDLVSEAGVVRASRLSAAGLMGSGNFAVLVADELVPDDSLRRLLRQLQSTGVVDQILGTPGGPSRHVRIEGLAYLDVALPDQSADFQDTSRLLVAQLDESPEQVRHTAGRVARQFTAAGSAAEARWWRFAQSVRMFTESLQKNLRVHIDRPERLLPPVSPMQLPRRLKQVLSLAAVLTLFRQHLRRRQGDTLLAEDEDLSAAIELLGRSGVLDEWEALGSREEQFFRRLTALPLPQAGFTYEDVRDALAEVAKSAPSPADALATNPTGTLWAYHTVRRLVLALAEKGLLQRKAGTRPILWEIPRHYRLWTSDSLFAQMGAAAGLEAASLQ